MMKCIAALTACMILSSGALWAQEAAADPAATNEPVQGTVTGENVYVRPTPTTETRAYIFKAYRGDKLIVLGKQGEWFRIKVPRYLSMWVDETFAKVDDEKATATLTSDQVNLRAGAGIEYNVVGRLSKGTTFMVVRKFEGYVCLKPALGAEGWIYEKYLSVPVGVPIKETPEGVAVGPASDTTTPATQPVAASRPSIRDPEAEKKFAEIETRLEAEMKKPEGSRDVLVCMEELKTLNRETKDPFVRIKIRKVYEHHLPVARRERVVRDHKAYLQKVEDGLKKIQDKYGSQAPASQAAADIPVATGIVKSLSYKRLPPATHKLVQGERVMYLLHSSTVKLDNFDGVEMAVYGAVSRPEGFPCGVSLIEVSRARGVETPATP